METRLQGNRTSCQKAANTGRKMAQQKPKWLREYHLVHLHKANIFNTYPPHPKVQAKLELGYLRSEDPQGQKWFSKAYVEWFAWVLFVFTSFFFCSWLCFVLAHFFF